MAILIKWCWDYWIYSFQNLVGPPAIAERILSKRVCLSFCQSFHISRCFLGVGSITFSTFWRSARNPDEVVCKIPRFFGKFFGQTIEKMGQEYVFLNRLKHLVINFYRICSMMKIYIICCDCTQIPCMANVLFLRYWSNFFQPIRSCVFRTNQ